MRKSANRGECKYSLQASVSSELDNGPSILPAIYINSGPSRQNHMEATAERLGVCCALGAHFLPKLRHSMKPYRQKNFSATSGVPTKQRMAALGDQSPPSRSAEILKHPQPCCLEASPSLREKAIPPRMLTRETRSKKLSLCVTQWASSSTGRCKKLFPAILLRR